MSKADNTEYLDLDAIVQKKAVVRLKGVDHPLKEATVEDFLENIRLINEAPVNASVTDEINFAATLLQRAFPTMKESDLRAMSLPQLNALQEFAKKHNGQGEVDEAAKADAAQNPQPAG